MKSLIMMLVLLLSEGFLLWSLSHIGALEALIIFLIVNSLFGLIGACWVDLVNPK